MYGEAGVRSGISHGAFLSVALHGGLVFALAFGIAAPGAFPEVAREALEVDVVTPQEAAEETNREHSPVPNHSEAKPQERPSQSQTQSATPTPEPGASLAAQPQASSRPAEPGTPPAEGMYSAFDTASIAALYNMKPPLANFDAPSTQIAKLANEEVAAFRAQLRRCWRQPEGVSASSRARVLMRVSFTPDGMLAAEPSLIEASASRDGPMVYKAALQALSQCQPFSTLPRERYREWKTLDVTFSPVEMAGG